MKILYEVWNGKLEKHTILQEHNINEGASQETYICRDSNGRKFVCSKDYGFLSEKEAWQDYYNDIGNGIEEIKREIEEKIKHKEFLLNELLRVRNILWNCD